LPETSADHACEITRENLGKLKRKEGSELAEPDNRERSSIFVLGNNLRNVNRGTKVNRLYSPWVVASKRVRKLFTLDGGEIVSLDMRAAQPTFVACFARDDQLLTACMEDKLYGGLMSHLSAQRDKTKKYFLAYLFGHIRKSTTGLTQAFEIQEYMAQLFPITANYVEKEKTPNFKNFARKLQNYEADIFVDGIFMELAHRNITALTVHDSISCQKSKVEECRQVMKKIISDKTGNSKFVIKEE